MAVSGTIVHGFEVYRLVGFTSTPVLRLVAGAAIPTIGTVLIQAAGKVVVATAANTLDVVGVAASTAAADGDAIDVIPAWPGVIWSAVLEDQSNENHVSVQDNLLNTFAIHVDPAGSKFHYIDENVTNDTAKVVATCGAVDPLGTTRGRVQCVFLGAATIWGGGTVKAHA